MILRNRKHFHRIASERRARGMSIRTAAKRLGWSVARARATENEHYDIPVSELVAWQTVLEVSLDVLVREPSCELSSPIAHRAQLIQIMKSVATLQRSRTSTSVSVVADRIAEDLVELMPALQDVRGWPSIGSPRSSEELGRSAQETISSDLISGD